LKKKRRESLRMGQKIFKGGEKSAKNVEKRILRALFGKGSKEWWGSLCGGGFLVGVVFVASDSKSGRGTRKEKAKRGGVFRAIH